MSERLQKVISRAGLMSRRAAEELISQGRIAIDGRIAVLGDRVDPSSQQVLVDGVPIPIAPDLRTYLVNKPLGVISTADDPQDRKTVVDLVASDVRVWPVGRLDADSEGLILVSNDGELTNRVTHPRYGVTKTYTVVVAGLPSKATVRRLTEGVELDDGPAAATSARIVDRSNDTTMIELVMNEGRNREIRRMCDTIGHSVVRLVRTAIGPLTDRALRPGSVRMLAPGEVAELYRAAIEPDHAESDVDSS
ncbi:MAG: rRNA pseudouridine synthase [Acidimicrobiia bacterium]|nr:rRNA pseudouridine synthase [Acidimicrobiia bacterium]